MYEFYVILAVESSGKTPRPKGLKPLLSSAFVDLTDAGSVTAWS
jgi:hypothetical protein